MKCSRRIVSGETDVKSVSESTRFLDHNPDFRLILNAKAATNDRPVKAENQNH